MLHANGSVTVDPPQPQELLCTRLRKKDEHVRQTRSTKDKREARRGIKSKRTLKHHKRAEKDLTVVCRGTAHRMHLLESNWYLVAYFQYLEELARQRVQQEEFQRQRQREFEEEQRFYRLKQLEESPYSYGSPFVDIKINEW